ncbi:MAG: hypothetical protein CVV27_08780 [Candidatus Melainabacteria bacterium HGW-Melainabacteria-1]|nr:MAG: hypothetical protein CVV27_08780 [Candidatus Melainabacteria bacterium HGW-Melainabacteria-1]
MTYQTRSIQTQSFKVLSAVLASSLLILSCSQSITQNATVIVQPKGDFAALGGVSLDPTIAKVCGGETVAGDQGYARSMARQYRQHLNQLMRLTSGGQFGNTGSIYGENVRPGASPTTGPTADPGPTAAPTDEPTAQPTSAPTAEATSDISVVEKTTFNGKIFDALGNPLDGVEVKVRSLNTSVPFEAITTTAGGTFAFNNAPAGVQIEITATRPGYAPRSRTEVLKSNKQGDPNANRFDFGSADSSSFGSSYGALSDLPEVIRVSPGRNVSGVSADTSFALTFSEPMDRATVEQGLLLNKYLNSGSQEDAFDISAFNIVWNSDDTEIQLTFKPGIQLTSQNDYAFAFKPGSVIKDKTGNGRDSSYFKLTEGDYENWSKFSVLSFMTMQAPAASPTPLPPPEKERDQFYFSYDDSASVAGVELVKHALQANQIPDPSWARTWEFLNYEPFDHVDQQSTGQFKVSLGLWKYPDPANPYLDRYEVGAHVTAPYRCKATRAALNLTILVDVSGSMLEPAGLATSEGSAVPSKLALAKAGLKDLSANLRPGDIVNLMLFSNKTAVEVENYVVGSDPASKYLEGIERIAAEGGTNLQAAIDAGYRQAQKNFDRKKMNRLLMITDAQPTEGNTDLALIRGKARLNDLEGVYLSALGIGHSHNQELLNEITEAGRGAYFTVQNRSDMKEAIGDRFIPLMDVIARNVRFKIEFPGWMRHGKSAAEQVSSDPSKVQPTNFSANTSQYFWEQFKANKTDYAADQTVRLSISFTDPISGREQVESIEKPLAEILDKDLGNIKAAHLVQLTTALIKKEVTAREVDQELRELLPDTGK